MSLSISSFSSYSLTQSFYPSQPALTNQNGILKLGNRDLTVKNITQSIADSFNEEYYKQCSWMLDHLPGLPTEPVDIIKAYLGEEPQPARRPGATAPKPVDIALLPTPVRVQFLASSFFPFPQDLRSGSFSSVDSHSTPSAKSLMQISTLPPLEYSVDFDCSDDNLKENIITVATFISKVYASFLKLGKIERQQLREKGVWIPDDVILPCAEDCAKFEDILKQKIIGLLNENDDDRLPICVKLSIDYSPEGELEDACESAFYLDDEIEINSLFPHKSSTTIFLNTKKTKLELSMNFKGL